MNIQSPLKKLLPNGESGYMLHKTRDVFSAINLTGLDISPLVGISACHKYHPWEYRVSRVQKNM